jgi:hypothetical protein
MWVAWPCTPWSIDAIYTDRRTPAQRRRLVHKQQQGRILLQFVRDLARFQHSRGRLFMGENPSTSLAWEEHAIQWAAALAGFETADFDWCR